MGRRICLMESADAALPSRRTAYLQACYASIDQRLANQAATSAGRAFAREAYQHCLLYQDRVKSAAQERAVALDAWLEAAHTWGARSSEARRAMRQQDRAMANLERWIPRNLRHGLPLEPDAIRVFSRCDPQDF
ncbi:MAG: hypothetical protein ACOVNL_09795 [Prochlorococcaceae cyanobacterium]|jgi:hypothetical protein